jgi:hypothetical protein
MQDHEQTNGKKIHAPDGFGFEGDVLVPVTWPDEPELTPQERLILDLLDCGCVIHTSPEVNAAVERAFDIAGYHRGADALRHLADKLKGTAAGEAVRRVITGASEPLQVAADRAHCSRTAIFLQEKTIRKRLGMSSEDTQKSENPNKSEA